MALNNLLPASHRELLEQLSAPMVQSLAKILARVLPTEIDPRALPTRKPECIQLILNALAGNQDFARVYAELSKNEKQTIGEIVNSPSLVINSSRYEAIYRVKPSIPTIPNSTTAKLLHAFVSSYGSIPADAAVRLRPLAPQPKAPAVVYLPGDPPSDEEHWVHVTEQAACHDVLAVLNLIDQKAIKVSATTGQLTEGGAAPLRAALLAGDYYAPEQESDDDYDVPIGKRGIKPFAWALLIQAAGLASISSGKLALTAAGNKARTQPPHELLRTLWLRWLKYTDFHEFSRLEEIKGQKSAKHPLTKPNDARKAIGNILARLEVNQWIDLDEFFTYMYAISDGFNVVRNEWALYRLEAGYGSFGQGGNTWDYLNGRYAMAFLLEYCATLGIIDVGISLPWGARDDFHGLWGWDEVSCMSRYDGLFYLRLTPLGAWILGAADTYVPQRISTPSCKVLPNLDIVLCRQVEPGVRIQLERIAELVSDNVYHLTKEKLLQACEEGVAIRDLQDFLTDQIDHELPDTVRVLFREIEDNLRKFSFDSTGYLIHCSEPWLTTLVCNDAMTKQFCLAVNDHHFFLRKGAEKAFRTALKKMGYIIPNLPVGEG